MTAEFSVEVIEGPDAGRLLMVDRSVDIGREVDTGLILTDRLVSRRHARLFPVAGGLAVEDVGSSHGTIVNGASIEAAVQLRRGDHVQMGSTVLLVRGAHDIASRASAVRPVPPPLAAQARPPDYVPPQALKGPSVPELEPLLDMYTKAKTRTAPLAIFVLVAFAVIIALALVR